jgi:hypothetical protein
MRPDRPLIVSILFLAAGLGLTFGYCDGTVGLNAGYPLSAASFKLCVSTFGPAAIGGPILTLLGLLLLVWALVCAIFSQFGLGGSSREHDQDPLRLME